GASDVVGVHVAPAVRAPTPHPHVLAGDAVKIVVVLYGAALGGRHQTVIVHGLNTSMLSIDKGGVPNATAEAVCPCHPSFTGKRLKATLKPDPIASSLL